MSQVQYWVNGDGVTQSWTLPSIPYGPIRVYWDGIIQPPSTYSISGQVVTVTFLPQAGPPPDQVGFLYSTSAVELSSAAALNQFWVQGDGVTQAWMLPYIPLGQIEAHLNGVLLPPSTYSVIGAQVTLNFVPDAGPPADQVAFVFYSPIPPAEEQPAYGGDSLIQVAEVVNDPDLAQPFTILRSGGSWVNGVWQSLTTQVQSYGVIAEPTVREIEMIPEGDLVRGAIVFWSAQPIYGTHATNGSGGSSDILIWRGHNYRVLDVKQYQDWGFYRAMATRMKAD